MEERKRVIIEKIEKILVQAKDQEGTPEGDTFKRHAALLMAKYRIEETEIDLETDNFIMDTFEFYLDNKKRPQWVFGIINTFSYLFDTKSVFRKYYNKTEWEIIGTFSDVETTIYFIDVVVSHINNAGWKKFPQKTYSKKRNQFGNVAASVIWERGYELKNQMDKTIHEDNSCTSLVVKKMDEVKEAVEALYPEMKAAGARKLDLPNDRDTWNAGKKAGETAPLHFGIEG